jgi:hypothetical protein
MGQARPTPGCGLPHDALCSPHHLQVGWRHHETIKELEAKRKVKSAAFYAAKKRLLALRAKAVAQVEAGKA